GATRGRRQRGSLHCEPGARTCQGALLAQPPGLAQAPPWGVSDHWRAKHLRLPQSPGIPVRHATVPNAILFGPYTGICAQRAPTFLCGLLSQGLSTRVVSRRAILSLSKAHGACALPTVPRAGTFDLLPDEEDVAVPRRISQSSRRSA